MNQNTQFAARTVLVWVGRQAGLGAIIRTGSLELWIEHQAVLKALTVLSKAQYS